MKTKIIVSIVMPAVMASVYGQKPTIELTFTAINNAAYDDAIYNHAGYREYARRAGTSQQMKNGKFWKGPLTASLE